MSAAVQGIVGQFDLVEEQCLRLPMGTGGRAIRMQVHPLGALWLSSSGRNPLGSGELVATVADGHHLQEHAIAGLLLQSAERNSHRGEHASARRKRIGLD